MLRKLLLFFKFAIIVFINAIIISAFAQSTKEEPIENSFPNVIYIIRHGEKPLDKNQDKGNLVCNGLIRSLKLPSVLKNLNINKIVAPKPNFSSLDNQLTTEQRSFETIIPFAIINNLPIYAHFRKDQIDEIAQELIHNDKGDRILMAWEHRNIALILNKLGVQNPPVWSDSDFDSIYKLTFNSKTGKPLLDTSMKQGIAAQNDNCENYDKLLFPEINKSQILPNKD